MQISEIENLRKLPKLGLGPNGRTPDQQGWATRPAGKLRDKIKARFSSFELYSPNFVNLGNSSSMSQISSLVLLVMMAIMTVMMVIMIMMVIKISLAVVYDFNQLPCPSLQNIQNISKLCKQTSPAIQLDHKREEQYRRAQAHTLPLLCRVSPHSSSSSHPTYSPRCHCHNRQYLIVSYIYENTL